MRIIACALFCLPLLAVEQVSTPIDNDQVKVLAVTVQPHEKTRLHDHKINRVMIYLDGGKQHFEYEGVGPSDLTWKAGEPKWSPAAGKHIAEITSAKPVRIIEVELKKRGGGLTPSATLDPVKIDPKHYKVEFENDQVRVVRVKIGPGESVPQHEHKLNRVVVYLSNQNLRATTSDGKSETLQHKAGEVSWGAPTKHTETNLAKEPFEVVVVELKG